MNNEIRNMAKVQFSIIIPIYNAEKTLKRCLDSIICQTFIEFEVLMIDDGSTDGSRMICEQYSNVDERFKYIYQINAGPSVARNKGLDNAIGAYIAFVDSDDYIKEDYLNRLYSAFTLQTADVVFVSYTLVGQEIKIVSLPILEESYYYNLIQLSRCDMFGYTWIKAFRGEKIGNLRFNSDFRIMEDEMFACEVLKQDCIISFVNDAIYYYCPGRESLVKKTHDNYCEACDIVYKLWKQLLQNYDNNNSKEYLKEKSNLLTNNCKYYGLEKKVNTIDFYKKLSKCLFFKDSTIEDILIDSIKNNDWNKVKHFCNKYRIKNSIIKLIR